MAHSIEYQNFLAHYSQLAREEQTEIISKLINLRKKPKFLIKCKLVDSEITKIVGSCIETKINYTTSISGRYVIFNFKSANDRNTTLLHSAWSK